MRHNDIADAIEMAKNDPRYLTEEYWLCHVLFLLAHEKKINGDIYKLTTDHIREVLDGYCLLMSLLKRDRKVHVAVSITGKKYKVAAMAFWDDCIQKLRSEKQ